MAPLPEDQTGDPAVVTEVLHEAEETSGGLVDWVLGCMTVVSMAEAWYLLIS